mgnify:CR=1 FL=1
MSKKHNDQKLLIENFNKWINEEKCGEEEIDETAGHYMEAEPIEEDEEIEMTAPNVGSRRSSKNRGRSKEPTDKSGDQSGEKIVGAKSLQVPRGKARARSPSATSSGSRSSRRRSSADSQTITSWMNALHEEGTAPYPVKKAYDYWKSYSKSNRRTAKTTVLAILVAFLGRLAVGMWSAALRVAPSTAIPQLVFFNHKQGRMVDDYLRSFLWMRDNTPKDARILAWWDYGYQINGIAQRTSLADGNTWNHDHIAFVGRCLMSPEKRAHNIIRHVADYVYIWAGGNGDDVQKSMHIARITNSVYPDLCKGDPHC